MGRLSISLACILVATSGLAAAATLVPLGSSPGGQPPEQSVRDWTEWMLAFDRERDGGDPLTDATGAVQHLHQTYPVVMVGGALWQGVERSTVARPGRPFLVPMFNLICVGDPEHPLGGCAGGYDLQRELITQADHLYLRVDGTTFVDAWSEAEVDAVGGQFLVDSGLFPVNVAENSILTLIEPGAPGGLWPEAYNIGYFAALVLPVGAYLIEFGGGGPQDEEGSYAAVGATLHLTVIPVPATLPLLASGLAALGWAARRRRERVAARS